MKVRCAAVAAATLALVLLAACGDDDAHLATTSGTAEAVPSGASLGDFARRQPGFQLRSDAVADADGSVGVIGTATEQGRQVLVVVDSGGGWRVASTIDLPEPRFPFLVEDAKVEVGDVTGDGRPDFLVPVSATHPVGVVISGDGGRWRAVPVQAWAPDAPDQVYLGLEPHVQGDAVTALDRTCEPDCASGPEKRITYRYEGSRLTRP